LELKVLLQDDHVQSIVGLHAGIGNGETEYSEIERDEGGDRVEGSGSFWLVKGKGSPHVGYITGLGISISMTVIELEL
jgi:hypothetical protein